MNAVLIRCMTDRDPVLALRKVSDKVNREAHDISFWVTGFWKPLLRPRAYFDFEVARQRGLQRFLGIVWRSVSAAVCLLSCEPLIGSLAEIDLSGIHWVIVGGESGALPAR